MASVVGGTLCRVIQKPDEITVKCKSRYTQFLSLAVEGAFFLKNPARESWQNQSPFWR